MEDRQKKNLTVKNKTHYFDKGITKTRNSFINPNTYYYKVSKIQGYTTRLFYEFKYCQDHNGQTFFYTLTYNDANIPKYLGRNCFDYNDLRDLLNGAFTKFLLRNYGTKMKYFVGAELGDGKGYRGYHNHPHYHILFFLTPTDNPDYTYKKIPENEMTSLLRIYWQGEDTTDFKHRAQYFKKGIVNDCRPGLGPVVNDFKAISYVSKYATKDIGLIKHEEIIRDHFRVEYSRDICDLDESLIRYWDDYIVPVYNPNGIDSDKELFRKLNYEYQDVVPDGKVYWCKSVIDSFGLYYLYKDFCRQLVEEKVNEKVKEYRNRYCNKCRISQGVGAYGLDFIEDEMDPMLPVPGEDGIKYRSIGQYYYRKKYCDVVKDDVGQNIYVLNQLGIDYKCNKLKSQIDKLADRAFNNINMTLSRERYDNVVNSEINDTVGIKYDDYKNFINTLDIKKLVRNYAEYKLVYEGRFFPVSDYGDYPVCDVYSDYRKFITPLIGKVPYSDTPVNDFLESTGEGYLAYNTHPYFLSNSWFFPVLDLLDTYYFIQGDNQKQKEAEERAQIRKFHIGRKIEELYG